MTGEGARERVDSVVIRVIEARMTKTARLGRARARFNAIVCPKRRWVRAFAICGVVTALSPRRKRARRGIDAKTRDAYAARAKINRPRNSPPNFLAPARIVGGVPKL